MGLSRGNCVVLIVLLTFYKHARTQTTENRFSLLPSNITARVMFPARFDCQPTAGFVRWVVGDGIMASNSSYSGYVLLGNGSLYFPSVTQDNAGRYTCFIIGVLGPTPRYSVYLTVAEEAPRITSVTPANVTIIQNETLDINVSVTGVPQPDVTWRKDNKNLNDDPRFTITGVNLRLPNAQPSDAGEYRITAHNIADTEVERYNVIVQFPPIITITRNSDGDVVDDDTMVTVTCMITSNPQSRISWEQITSNDRTDRTDRANIYVYTLTHSTNSLNTVSMSTINFTNEAINGFSTFCCSASNDIGLTSSCLNFTETGAPPRPSGFSVTECTSSLIAVQWDLPSLDGVAHELSYRIDNSNNGSWGRETVESGATSYKLENLRPNTSYVLRLTASRNSIRSLPTSQLIVRTRISVPRDVRSFKVDSTASPGTFVLTWQAPLESVVDYYIVYVRGPYNNTIEVDGTKLGLSISDLSENVEYMFAIQAVNDGGSGNMTSYRSGIFCLTTPMITAQYRLHRTTVNISWHLSDSIYSMRNIMLVIAEQSGTTFTSELIDATNRQRCISNLRLNTRYEITVIAILGCDNVSSELDVLTQSTDKPATRLPSQNCIVFNATTSGLVSDARSGSDGRSSNSSAISSGFVGGVILLLLMITVVLCIVLLHKRRSYRKAILSLNFNVEKDSGNDVMPDLCNTIEPGDSDDPITTNPIYATITEASEDKCKYVQTNDFDEYLDLEDTVTKMNTNPLYGVNTGNVHSASNAQSSNETDYGVVNQPKSDGPDSLIT